MVAAVGLGFGLTNVFDLDFAGLGTPFILTIAIYAGIELIALIGRPFVATRDSVL